MVLLDDSDIAGRCNVGGAATGLMDLLSLSATAVVSERGLRRISLRVECEVIFELTGFDSDHRSSDRPSIHRL